VERKYVDVNVFVYWLSGSGKLLEKAKKWIKAIEDGARGEFLTSALTIYELIIIIAGLTGKTLKDTEFIKDVLEALLGLSKLRIVPLSKEVFRTASEAMTRFSLDFEDAIHYATAIKHGATKIISNDRDFEKTDIQRIF